MIEIEGFNDFKNSRKVDNVLSPLLEKMKVEKFECKDPRYKFV
jgi:hypothetical protein